MTPSSRPTRFVRPSYWRRPLAAVTALAVFHSPVSARADDAHAGRTPSATAPPNRTAETAAASAPSATELSRELDVYAEQGRRERVVTNVVTLAAGAALVPTGVVLSTRDDQLAKTLGLGMTLGGSIPLLFLFATILPSRMERLRDEFDARRASGVPDAELVHSLEAHWAESARGAHNRRVVVGIVDLSLGTAALGAGTYFLLAKPLGKMARDDQYTLGYSLAASGLPIAAFGVRSLVQKSLEEMSWDAHRAAHGPSGEARAPLTAPGAAVSTAPTVAVTALPGGAAAFARLVF